MGVIVFVIVIVTVCNTAVFVIVAVGGKEVTVEVGVKYITVLVEVIV